MALHTEIRPSDATLPLMLASAALQAAETSKTSHSGMISVDNQDGTTTIIGGATPIAPWVGDETIPSRPTGLTATCTTMIAMIRWGGELEDGIPDDFSHIEITARINDGDAITVGSLTAAGELPFAGGDEGDIIEYWAIAYDNAHAADGTPAPHASSESDHGTIIIQPIISRDELNERADDILNTANKALADQTQKTNDALAEAQKRISANEAAQDAINERQEETDRTLRQARETLDKATSDITANETAIAANKTTIEQARNDLTKAQESLAQAQKDIASNAANTLTAQQAAANASNAAKTAQTTADNATSTAKTAQDTALAAKTAAADASRNATQAVDAATAARTAAESAEKTATNAQTVASTASSAAADASRNATQAIDTAATAKTIADDAGKIATQAKATADTASQAATDAATAARKANESAASAAGIAEGKADVLIQPSEPPAAMRRQTTLWIDTTGNANTPKRWDGTAWRTVTDKAATDAANAAAAAKTAADNAQGTANQATVAAANAAAKAQKAQDTADGALTTADGKSTIYRQTDEPANARLKPSDLWWRTQKAWTRWSGTANGSASVLADFTTAWQGEPGNSPSVLTTLSDRIVEVRTWDGDRWNEMDIVASNVLATGTVTADLIAANSVTADKIAANSVTTDKIAANSIDGDRIRAASMNADRIVAGTITAAQMAAGAVTADKIAASAVTADKIAATALYGKTVSGGTITTTNGRLLLNDAGLTLSDGTSTTLAMDAATGAVVLKGDLTSGSTISGGTITGSVIQTSAAAKNGLKITTGGLVAYGPDGNATFALSNSGEIAMDGAILSNGTITAARLNGGLITGSTIQSSAQQDTGLKISGNTLDMWDSDHNHTVHLDGSGNANLLTGTFQTAASGKRVLIDPDFRTSIAGSPDNTQTGVGVQFVPDGSYAEAPYIGTEFEDSDRGLISTICLNGGMRTDGSAGAGTGFGSFMRLGQYRNGGSESAEFLALTKADYLEKSQDTGQRQWYTRIAANNRSGNGSFTQMYAHRNGNRCANVYAWANDSANSGYTYAGLESVDSNGSVGIQACIDTGLLHFGGFCGGWSNRATFVHANWKIHSGTFSKGMTLNATNCTWTPAKYGRYYAVACADVNFGAISLHVLSTGGAGGCQVMGYNAAVADFNGDCYCDLTAWLVK